MPRKISRYGWKPQLPDHRDLKVTYAASDQATAAIDLRADMPPVYDQGELGSCTCNSTAAAVDYERKRQGLSFLSPARLWLYYCVREMEGTLGQDSGAEIRDVIKILASKGVPPESMWPYDESKLNSAPPRPTFDEAVKHETLKYRSPYTDLQNLKNGLALGYPLIFGFTVYESFEGDRIAQDGMMPMPLASESSVGGHAVVACGYDDRKNLFLVRNSWGSEWGDHGYFWMPYDYMANPDLVDDFWSIRLEA